MPQGPFRLPEGQDKPLETRRGGSVCQPGQGGLLQGSGGAAVCMPTVGADKRPRWRKAGAAPNKPSRHSTAWAQSRKLRSGQGMVKKNGR